MIHFKKNNGFSLLETLIYVALVAITLLLIGTFVFWFNYSNSKTKAQRESLENAQRAMDAMLFEIKGAKSIYVPTSGENQISLETSKYLPEGETNSFVDFFTCGTRICMKKESDAPIFLTSETVEVVQLKFTRAEINFMPLVRIELSLKYASAPGGGAGSSLVNLISTASLRSR